jgi:hypothetical protein
MSDGAAAAACPAGCIAQGFLERRLHSKLSFNKLSKSRAVRAGVRLGAVTAKYERRWFSLMDSGELQWQEGHSDADGAAKESCTILNAHVTAAKEFLVVSAPA